MRKALHEIVRPLVGSTITPVVVFLPLIAVTGVTGSFFRALAITMAVALLTSLVLAVSFTPGLALLLLGERKIVPANSEEPRRGDPLGRIMGWHRQALDWSLERPAWLGVLCVLLVAATYFGYRSLGSDLLPEMDEGTFILDYVMPAGASIASTRS